MKLSKCSCVLPGHHHGVDAACGRIYWAFDPSWICRAPNHAHSGELRMLRSGGTVPKVAACSWCGCPAISSIPPEPAVPNKSSGVGGDPLQEQLRIELLAQERNDNEAK